MNKHMKIYGVSVEQIVRKKYKIQAQTEEEALKIAEEFWDDTNPNDVDGWDTAEIKITGENNAPIKSDLAQVHNPKNENN